MKMSGTGSFKSYVDIFDVNELNSNREGVAYSENYQEPFEVISTDDIGNEAKPEHGIEVGGSGCDIVYDLIPVENSLTCSNRNSVTVNKEESKLCGFLRVHKQNDINKRRRRWFVFTEENCRLLYFKTPHDMIPRCDIDIANSSFYIHVNDSEVRNRFEIRIRDDVYILEAPDQKTMFYWLQELQNRRRRHSQRKAKSLPLKLSVPGHLEHDVPDDPRPNYLLDSVSLPRGTVGDHTKNIPGHVTGLSFLNLRDEMRKAMTGIVSKRDSANSSGVLQNIKSKVSDRAKILRPKRNVNQSGDDISNEMRCSRCSVHVEQVEQVRDELVQVEEELQATRQITRILQKQLDEQISQAQLQARFESASDENQLIKTILQEQQKKIIDLEYLLTATQEEKEILSANIRNQEAEVTRLEEQVCAFKASLASKDTVVMSLVSELHERDFLEGRQETGSQAAAATVQAGGLTAALCGSADEAELQKLQDAVQGYKHQNQFLNQEILELTRLRQDDATMIQDMLQTCVKLETNYYDVHRKYVSCLKELGKVQAEEERTSSMELLQGLIKDAMLSASQMTSPSASANHGQPGVPIGTLVDVEGAPQLTQYDALGFPVKAPWQRDSGSNNYDDTLDSLEQQSDTLFVKAKSIEHNLTVSLEWERFLANKDLARVENTRDLKMLIRAGVPNAHRAKLWKRCVDVTVQDVKSGYGLGYYDRLIENIKLSPNLLNPAAKQVELDLLRTLPGNKYYECIYEGNVPKLRRVLLAYAEHDPVTGYCQGLNRLAAIALLFLDEEDAFWCLVAVINHLLPHSYFCSGMQGAHMDQRVLCDLVQEKLPAVHAHFKHLEVDMTMFTFNWFLTVFIDNVPVLTYLRIWDSFLYEGSKVLFRYALAFLKYREREILSVTNSGDLYLAMRKLGERMIDINAISQIAFKGMNPFPMKHIQDRRQHHLAAVSTEFARIDRMRESRRQTRPASSLLAN